MTKLKSYINKNLPDQITSYDLLKSFALITMIIDHVGAYLYPEVSELRAIGRLSMPVWLFLVGYARSRDLGVTMWVGALLLIMLDLALGQGLFRMNILVTIILARLSLDFMAHMYLKGRDQAVFTFMALALLMVPTTFLFDYGTHAFLFALFGYLVRHQSEQAIPRASLLIMAGGSTFCLTTMQLIGFPFSLFEQIFASVGVFMVCFYLISYPPQKKPIQAVLWGKILLKFMGRRSLEIYVLHLFIFKIWAVTKFPTEYNLWNLSLF